MDQDKCEQEKVIMSHHRMNEKKNVDGNGEGSNLSKIRKETYPIPMLTPC